MFDASEKAVEKLQERLVHKCFEMGIGFRILVGTDKSGKATFSLKLDKQRQGDEIIDSDDVKLFLDPSSAAQVRGYRLDYQAEPDDSFFLKTRQETKDG